jgi:threonine synthase
MKLVSTRTPGLRASFVEAALAHAAPDGGLWVPEALPRWNDVDALLAMPFADRNVALLERLVGDEFAPGVLAPLVRGAFDFPAVVRPADGTHDVLELFHGPTLAFKDFGARFLAAVVRARSSRDRLVLTATSGDTGAAVAAAFHGMHGVRVAVLYPRGRVSPLQERQLACLGGNVAAYAVDGSFDDCQALAKRCFADAALSDELGLTSANSINIARLLGQVVYYFEAAARLRERHAGAPLVVAVPSGNFGNLCAGLYARALGLPVARFIAATNANRTVPEHLDTGVYTPRASVATHSNAMDVGAPSNWERVRHLFGDDLEALRSALRWGAVDDAGTERALRVLLAAGYASEPHAAVAWDVLRRTIAPGERGVFLATAHPAKFPELLEPLLGRPVPLPPALEALLARPLRAHALANDHAALVEELRNPPAA